MAVAYTPLSLASRAGGAREGAPTPMHRDKGVKAIIEKHALPHTTNTRCFLFAKHGKFDGPNSVGGAAEALNEDPPSAWSHTDGRSSAAHEPPSAQGVKLTFVAVETSAVTPA